MKDELINKIRNAVHEAQKGSITAKELFKDDSVTGPNEFLFFIKPEITVQSDKIDLDKILELLFEKIAEYQFEIRNINILPASYLKQHNLIAQHYGVINAIAGNVLQNLNAEAKEKFNNQYDAEIEKVKIYGGIEFIKAYPDFTSLTVDYLWQNSPTVKLGGGAYGQMLQIDGEKIYLVNGFHPRQLEHFIASGRSIVTFTLAGKTDWKTARNSFIGKTNPSDAEKSSIRRQLLDNKDIFRLTSVNSSWNGVHLSAGPVEALVELIRYNSNFDSGKILTVQDFKFGKELASIFSADIVQRIILNDKILFDGKSTTVFDLTEEMDSTKALEILKKVYKTN
jgi:hypothetical protein